MLLTLGTPHGFSRRPHHASNLLPEDPPARPFSVRDLPFVHSPVSPSSSSILPELPDLRLPELLVSSLLPEPPDPLVVRGEEEAPDPPVPPDPPDFLVDSFRSVFSSPSFTLALRLVSDRDMCLVSTLSLRDPCVDLAPFVFFSDTFIALVRLITAVCRFYTEVSRFESGFFASFSSFSQVFKTCRFSKVEMGTRITSSLKRSCMIRLFTNVLALNKFFIICVPCLWLDNLYHYYSFMENCVTSNSPFVGKPFNAGIKIFMGVGRLTISIHLGKLSSKAHEVPLLDFKGLVLKNDIFSTLEEVVTVLQMLLNPQSAVKCFKSIEDTVEFIGILFFISVLYLRIIPLLFELVWCTAFVSAVSLDMSALILVSVVSLFSCSGE